MLLPKPLKYAAISGAAAVFGALFGWVMFPAILKYQLKKEMALSKKTDVRKMWETIPFPLDFKIYFFNYTNADEVQNGAIPIVKEIGPYYFEQWREKLEIQDHEDNDTVSYKMRDTFLFKAEQSGPGLTGEEMLTVPHPIILGAVGATSRTNPAMVGMVGKALNAFFDKPTDVFMRIKAMDLMFRGFMLDCAKTEFAPKAVCTSIKKDSVPGFQWEANNQIRFSLFGTRNHTINQRAVTVKRGIRNISEVGWVVDMGGDPAQKIWRGSCNDYGGTDSTVFRPLTLTEHHRIEAFFPYLCRPFKPWYQRKSTYHGIKTNRYTVDIGDFANDPELNCFCEAPDKCPPKGMMDMMNCVKVPMMLTLPHFLECDPEVFKYVKGLNPNEEEHAMLIDFEPISGTTVVVRQRIQFNIHLKKTSKYEPCKNLPDTLAPFFWAEEGFALNKTFVKMLKVQLFIPKRIVSVIRWWLVSFGSLGVLIGTVYHFKDHIMRIATSGDKNKVTTVKPDEEEQKEISVIGQEPAKVNM